MVKFIVLCFIGLFIACSALVNSIPNNNNNDNANTEQNSLNPPQMVFDDAINAAFLANVSGFWTNRSTVLFAGYKMTDDGYFFFTNSTTTSGSFTLQTNYSFYGTLEAQKGIFISNDNDPNNPIQYKGVRLYNGQLAIEGKSYTNPKNANSSSGYTLYHRK